MASITIVGKALFGGFVVAIGVLAPGLGWTAEDPRDAAFLAPVLQRVLESVRTDVETTWRNPATGNGGSIVVERTFYREPQIPCRNYVRTLETAGAAPQVIRGTGCRSSTGAWQLEEEEPEPPVGPARAGTGPGPATPPGAGPDAVAEAGPTCPDTVLVPMPTIRPPAFAYTLPSRAEL